MSLSESISALCGEIGLIQSERSRSIGQLRRDVFREKEDNKRMMSNLHNERMKAAEEMRMFLHSENARMAKEVNDLMVGFRKERVETRNELLNTRQMIQQAFGIWRSFTAKGRGTRFSDAPISSARKNESAPPVDRPARNGKGRRRRR